jgi:hypothetical protein
MVRYAGSWSRWCNTSTAKRKRPQRGGARAANLVGGFSPGRGLEGIKPEARIRLRTGPKVPPPKRPMSEIPPDLTSTPGNCHLFPKTKDPNAGAISGAGVTVPSAWSVDSTKQIIADASEHDHGRHGPYDEYWHFRLLLRPGRPPVPVSGLF